MTHIVLVLFIASLVKCDWVEIPQATVSLDKSTETLDFASYMITTTSTTTQTPILRKPTVNKHIQSSNPVKSVSVNSNNDTIDFVSTSSSVVSTLEHRTNLVNVNNQSFEEETDTTEDNINDCDEYEATVDSEPSEEAGGYGYTNFIPYMSSIQSVLMKTAHKSRKSKVNVLKNLRDHLLGELEYRMSTFWNPPTENREAREYKDDSHVDFPSHEGALMTIGFLTFGVFLIKLVMQLIQAINNKVNNTDTTTTTTIIGRKRRAAMNEEAIKILNYIDDYRFK